MEDPREETPAALSSVCFPLQIADSATCFFLVLNLCMPGGVSSLAQFCLLLYVAPLCSRGAADPNSQLFELAS